MITELHQAIVFVFRKHPFDSQKKSSTFSPHITNTYRDVLSQIFPQIWNEYKDRKFKRKNSVRIILSYSGTMEFVGIRLRILN